MVSNTIKIINKIKQEVNKMLNSVDYVKVRRLTMELRDQRLPRCRTSARPIYGAQADVSVSTAASPESAVTSVSPPASLCGSSLASAPADSGVSFASLCSEVRSFAQ